MADLNGARNVVISLDIANARVKIMKILGQSPANSIIEYLPFDRSLIAKGEYGRMISSTLVPYLKRNNMRQAAFYFVLPDRAVSAWKMSMPALSRSKTEEALRAELNADLGDAKDYSVNTMQIVAGKKTNVFVAYCVKADIIKEITGELTRLGIEPRAITYTSGSVCNSVLFLRQRARQGTYMLVDARERETTLALVCRERLIESTVLPFGYEMLRTDKCLSEQELFPHDSATVVVMHAMETTTNALKNNEGEFDDDVMYYGVNPDGTLTAKSEIEELEKQVNDAISQAQEKSDADEALEKKFDEAMGNTSVADYTKASGAASSTADMSVTGGGLETLSGIEAGSPKDIVERNFKLMYKRILLYCESIERDPDLPHPDHIIMNFPKRYAFLLARANKEPGNKYEFKYFNPSIEDNPRFTENLDMFGALFTKVYNKNQTF